MSEPSALAATIAKHPRLTIALEQTMEVLTSPADHPFVLVVGPGGVGKSQLVQLLDNTLHWEASSLMEADPSFKPCIVVEAPASSTAHFDFLRLWERIIERAEGESRGIIGESSLALGKVAAVNGARGNRETDLFTAAVRACRSRTVQTILLDEANHLSVLAASARAPEQLDKLKDFAKSAGVRILLVGAFPVLAFRDISFQVARRIRTVPFLGYEVTSKRERAGFRAAAAQLLVAMRGEPVSLDDDLAAYLHEGSAGCVGNLRNWLVQAEHHMLRQPKARNLRGVLRVTAYPPGTLRQARQEIEAGKEILAGVRPPVPERPYSPPRTASGQRLKPGEAHPTRLVMQDAPLA
ncbi:MAG TPA: AAA family ATPase [Candidatus Dormibacteraeota bacterium]|nr:AAA family ATPase [Candidatus Dormibacteraeota bacterium]